MFSRTLAYICIGVFLDSPKVGVVVPVLVRLSNWSQPEIT